MLKYAIVVEHENDLPAYVHVDPGGHGHMSTSVINPPPDHFQYSSSELPAAMKALKRDYPTSFIVAHEVNFIDHEKMTDWWSRKKAQQLSAETNLKRGFSDEGSTARAARQSERGSEGAMPLMVGNIVILNTGSPPMTATATRTPARSYASGSRRGRACKKWNLRPRCCRTSLKPRDQTKGECLRSPTEQGSRRSRHSGAGAQGLGGSRGRGAV